MSADKRRNILIVFSALAVVLVGVIAYVSPTFRNENVSGAIGAVQKHRAPQIAQQDVVLGDEQTKQEQKVLYGDFLEDANQLRAINASIEMAARENAQAKFAGVQESLETRSTQLKRRFSENIDAAVAEAKVLAKNSANRAEVDQLGAFAESKVNLSDEDMDALTARVTAMNKSLSAGKADLVNSSKASLARVSEDLESRSSAAKLAAYAISLEAISKEARTMSRIANDVEALGAIAESRVLTAKSAGVRAILADEVQQLEMRAAKGMEAQVASEIELAAHLNRMVELAEAENNLEAKKQLADAEEALQARANANIKAQLAMIETAMAAHAESRLKNDEALEAFKGHISMLSKQAESKTAYAKMLGEQDFALQVRNFQSRLLSAQQR